MLKFVCNLKKWMFTTGQITQDDSGNDNAVKFLLYSTDFLKSLQPPKNNETISNSNEGDSSESSTSESSTSSN